MEPPASAKMSLSEFMKYMQHHESLHREKQKEKKRNIEKTIIEDKSIIKQLSAEAKPWVPDPLAQAAHDIAKEKQSPSPQRPLRRTYRKAVNLSTNKTMTLEDVLAEADASTLTTNDGVVKANNVRDMSASKDQEIEKLKKELDETKEEVLRLMKESGYDAKEIEQLKENNSRLARRARLALEKVDKETEKFKDEIDTMKYNMFSLKDELHEKQETIEEYRKITKEKQNKIQHLESLVEHSKHDWVSHSLKIKCILDEMKKSNTLPQDHAEWVYPMVEDIKIPHEMLFTNSEWNGRYLKYNFILEEVFKIGAIPPDQREWVQDMLYSIKPPEIPDHIRRRYLPSYEDAHYEDDGDEDEQADRIDDWTIEASQINLSENFTNLLIQDRPYVVSMVTRIQRAVRDYQKRKNPVQSGMIPRRLESSFNEVVTSDEEDTSDDENFQIAIMRSLHNIERRLDQMDDVAPVDEYPDYTETLTNLWTE